MVINSDIPDIQDLVPLLPHAPARRGAYGLQLKPHRPGTRSPGEPSARARLIKARVRRWVRPPVRSPSRPPVRAPVRPPDRGTSAVGVRSPRPPGGPGRASPRSPARPAGASAVRRGPPAGRLPGQQSGGPHVQDQVGAQRPLPREALQGLGLHAELLAQFAHQGLGDGLARFGLAARELPPAGQLGRRAAAGGQQAPVTTKGSAHDHSYSHGRSLCQCVDGPTLSSSWRPGCPEPPARPSRAACVLGRRDCR